MKTTKPKKSEEWISVSEFSRRAGVSTGAASLWLKAQREGGVELTRLVGRRGRIVNAKDPLIKAYIENSTGRSNRKNDATPAGVDSLRKLAEGVEKVRLQGLMLREKYIDRDFLFAYLDKYKEIEKRIFGPMGKKITQAVGKEFKVTDKKILASVQATLDKAFSSAMQTTARIIDDFKKKASA
jgi:hypothetical protein